MAERSEESLLSPSLHSGQKLYCRHSRPRLLGTVIRKVDAGREAPETSGYSQAQDPTHRAEDKLLPLPLPLALEQWHRGSPQAREAGCKNTDRTTKQSLRGLTLVATENREVQA